VCLYCESFFQKYTSIHVSAALLTVVSKSCRSVTEIYVFPHSGEADEDQRKVLKGMTEVAKEKETGALNESAESIKVMLFLDFVPSKEERSTQRERGGNEGEALVRFPVCDVLID
jgi:hypothetical protein